MPSRRVPCCRSVFDVKTQNNPLCEHQCEWCCTYLKHVACVVLGQMRDRRSRALAFLSPRQSTDGKSYYKYKLTRASASATATPLLTISNVLGRGQFSRGIRSNRLAEDRFPADFVILAESDEEAALLRWKGTLSFFRTITKSTLAMCCSYQPFLDTSC